MSYIKVLNLGHVIQVYEMEKEPFHLDKIKIKDDGYNPFDFDNLLDSDETRDRNLALRESLQQKKKDALERIEERRGQTIRDAKNTLKRLALANFNSNDIFMTLTYKENFSDVAEGDKHFSDFIQVLREETGQEIKYIAVREFQKRGALHYHVMMDWNIRFSEKWEVQVYERDLAKLWGHGFVDIERMDKHKSKSSKYKDKPIDNVGAYLSKYFAKSSEDERLQGHKLYLPSQGLIRPQIYKNDDAIKFLKENNILNKKMVFTNSYDSEYLGQITFKEYNLLRL